MKLMSLFTFFAFSISLQAQFVGHLISNEIDDGRYGLVADIDGDGDQDIIYNFGQLNVMHNTDGKGNFGEPVFLGSGGKYSKAIDVDQDGDLDIVHFSSNDCKITKNMDGNGMEWESEIISTFSQQGTYSFSYLEDIDGDGDQDIISSAMTWFENLDGQFTLSPEKTLYELPTDHDVSRSIHPVDWDSDGDTDVLINVGIATNKSQIYVLQNDGNNNYEPVLVKDTIASLDGLTFTQLADADNDGDFDLIVHNGPRNIGWYQNENTTLSDFIEIHEYFSFPGNFRVIDVNGDNELDVFWCGHGGKFWLQNLGNFTFATEAQKIGPDQVDATNDMAFGDLDGDLDIDIVTFGREISGFPQSMNWYENKLVLSTEDHPYEHNFGVYPNPTSGKLTIELDGQTYTMYNLWGQEVMTSNELKVDISHLPEGLYTIVTTVDGHLSSQQFYKAN